MAATNFLAPLSIFFLAVFVHQKSIEICLPVSEETTGNEFSYPSSLIRVSDGATLNHTRKSTNSNLASRNFTLTMLLLCGDIMENPGPSPTVTKTSRWKFPCGSCSKPVKANQKGICCDSCDRWYHTRCCGVGDHIYNILSVSSCTWICCDCGLPNFSDSFFDSSLDTIESENSFSVLNTSEPNLTQSSPPKCKSVPKATNKSTHYQNKQAQRKIETKPLKVAVVNCDGISGSKSNADFRCFLYHHKPDIVLGCESKLNGQPTYNIFPTNYVIYRKDRITFGGGVFIAIKDIYPSYPLNNDSNCEIIWASLQLPCQKKVLLASFYRPPHSSIEVTTEFIKSVNNLFQEQAPAYPHLIIGGDFNLPGIDWKNMEITGHNDIEISNSLMDCIQEHNLSQLTERPTRGENIIDLLFTSNPNMLSNETHAPSPSYDHDAVFFDFSVRPLVNSKPAYPVYLYKKANLDGLQKELEDLATEFTQSRNHRQYTVDENWEFFKTRLRLAADRHIPQKQVKPNRRLPWITTTIRRMMRKRERLFKKARKSKNATLWQAYKKYRNSVKKQIEIAHNKYVNEVIGGSLEDGDGKAFWNYIKLNRTDSIGVPPLKDENNNVIESNRGKANVLNNHFQSVFTNEDTTNIPSKGPSPFTEIEDIIVTSPGIEKQLQNLKPNKAAGPDQISPWILKNFANECARMLQIIYIQSYETGNLPSEWKTAVVSPIHKKDDKSSPKNYRPISLTCIACKVMEHVLCSHMSKFFQANNILSPHQHGFRKGFSTETQLITVLDDWLRSLDKRRRTDVLLLDFSKAFDTVPHKRLLHKLSYYGISGKTHRWIENFLTSRSQCVQVCGERSGWVKVSSGVPQGTVMGPLLFLIYINDITSKVRSKIKLFADDAVLYSEIMTPNDMLSFQHDINQLHKWSYTWQMNFNLTKCNIMSISRSKQTVDPPPRYHIQNHELEVVDSHKYLGVMIQDDLQWDSHVRAVKAKATKLLGLIRRNLSSCSPQVKEQAYNSLVRPGLEYAAAAWAPHEKQHIKALEAVQRSAVRFVSGNYSRYSSVTTLRRDLGWETLHCRRHLAAATTFYKIVNHLVYLPIPPTVLPADSRTRSNHPYKFRHIAAQSDAYKYSFFPHIIPLWNSLPLTAVTAASPKSFQTHALPAIRDFYQAY